MCNLRSANWRKHFMGRLVLFAATLPILAFIYLPIAWLVASSTSSRVELSAVPPHWIPQNPSLQNYVDILFPGDQASSTAKTYKVTLQNSLIVATSVTAISLVAGSLAAYALARIQFRFRRTILIGILATRMIPEVSLVIPLYVLASQIGILNTPTVLIFTYLSFALPFAIWLMAAFFETIPAELEDAARIDGCSRIGTLFKIIMPISAPGLVSTGLFVFLTAWDEFFFALIFTSTIAAKTVPVAIAEFTGRYVVDITGMMTGGVLAALPPVIMALAFQRYIVRGLTAGAVKG
ncbi:MAG TPA: carbohydrate ABC transporter permease [Aggregatilineales bacterium]|nr:carbohydrate ABC transporter permease [Aggregatilineales bacterium]